LIVGAPAADVEIAGPAPNPHGTMTMISAEGIAYGIAQMPVLMQQQTSHSPGTSLTVYGCGKLTLFSMGNLLYHMSKIRNLDGH
jgi:hypothetical protein